MSLAHIGLPNREHAAKYFDHYLNMAGQQVDLLKSLTDNLNEALDLIAQIPAEKENFAYAEEKWTVKDVLLHCIDTERIFQYRALRLGRNDATPLIGFDENAYAPFAHGEYRTLQSIVDEMIAVRNSTIALFKNFQLENFDFVGQANGHPLSARSAGWIMVGHMKHHLTVLTERYL